MPTYERRMTKGYNVYRMPDGDDPEYVGRAATLRAAARLAARAGRGEIATLPREQWDTARAAGTVAGLVKPRGEAARLVSLTAPEGVEEQAACRWIGRGGEYAVVRIVAEEGQ